MIRHPRSLTKCIQQWRISTAHRGVAVAADSCRCHFRGSHYHNRVWSADRVPSRRYFSQQETQGSGDDNSSTTTTTTTTKEEGFKGGPLVPFPWRHEQHMLPRLEMEALRLKGDFRARMFMRLWEKSTGVMMEVPWYHLLGNAWREDIAEPGAWAFSKGVAGLLSNIFRVPMNDIYSPDGEFEVNFVYTTPYLHDKQSTPDKSAEQSIGESKTTEKSSSALKDKAVEENSEPKTSSSLEHSKDDSPSSKEEDTPSLFCDEVKEMFEEKVYKHIQDIHKKLHNENSPPLEITLKMKPIDSQLWKLVCFPFLSRKTVEEDSNRRQEYIDLFEISRTQGAKAFFQHFWAFADKMLEERGTMDTTILADVIVDCIEVFQVKDLTSNKIVQGDNKERTVRHAIRMELDVGMVVDDNDDHYYYQKNWRITDFDDLFDNNQWSPLK